LGGGTNTTDELVTRSLEGEERRLRIIALVEEKVHLRREWRRRWEGGGRKTGEGGERKEGEGIGAKGRPYLKVTIG